MIIYIICSFCARMNKCILSFKARTVNTFDVKHQPAVDFIISLWYNSEESFDAQNVQISLECLFKHPTGIRRKK